MYYASPSDQGGWWGAGRWGVSMSDAPWHWLYKWLHLHAFHFPAHRSRDELIGPSLIGDDWLQLGLPAHPDGLHVWQRLLTQWLNCAPPTPTHIPVSLGPNCQRHKGGQPLSAPGHRCDHESVLALAEECTWQEEKEAQKITHYMRQLFWSVVTEWVMTLACCRLERDLSVRLLEKPTCHVMLVIITLLNVCSGVLLWVSVHQGSELWPN